MFRSVLVMIALSLCVSTSAFARGGDPVSCMKTAVTGESDGTASSMFAVAKTIMRRYLLGEGSICSIVYAPKQFVGVKRAAEKPESWKALAENVSEEVISKKLSHPFRQFRTTKLTSCSGTVIGGNTFFNSCGDRGSRSIRYASSRRHSGKHYARRSHGHMVADADNLVEGNGAR